MRLLTVIVASALACPIALPTARADAPNPLAPAVRALVWGGLCDSLSQNSDTDCTKFPTRCWAKRASGEAFEPVLDLDSGSVGYPYAVDGWLSSAAERSELPVPDDGNPLTRLTGVDTPERTEDAGYVGKLDPAQLTWLVENVAPKPTDELCGAPASKLYGAIAKPLVKILADAYLQLHGKGAFKDFNRTRYTTEYYEPTGRYTKMCKAFIGNPKSWAERAYRKFACGFWFRREYAGQRAEFVRAFADVVAPFDPALSKKLLKTLPKPR